MFVFSANFSNSFTGSRPYCAWVPVHENGRDRLVSIWIDPARTAFKSRLQEARGIDEAAIPLGRQEKTDVDQRDAEDLHKALPFCSSEMQRCVERTMLWHHFAIRLGLALVLGAFIGAERQWRQRMAGLRTNALVAAGAAMFVMLSTLAVRPDDSFRIAGKVVSGIGFLGAGVILRNGLNITGLNTAATLSCSAAIGTLAGYGMYGSAITGAVAVVAANVCLRPIGKALNRGMGTVDAGRQNSLLEQIVSRLSLEPGVSGVSWEIVAEHD